MKIYDLSIIGGGSSGLFAACLAAGAGLKTILLEAADRVGKKLLSTGNGQGNITCARLDPARYHGEDPSFCRPALAAFDNERARETFGGMGLLTVTEGDRVYPLPRQAGSIVDVLRLELGRVGAEVRTGFAARSARKKQYFEVSDGKETVYSSALLLATGGKSAPVTGHFEAGYEIARSFGHHVTPLFPSLVQLKGDMADCRVLKGVKCDVRLTLSDARQTFFSERGEILFCDYGISGKIVFEGSPYVSGRSFSDLSAHVDFLPDFSEEELVELLTVRVRELPHLPPESLLVGAAKSQVARAVLARAKLPRLPGVSGLHPPDLARVAGLLKDFSLKLTGLHAFELAQVTRGGVKTGEADPGSMMSRLCPGLYFSGEILDVDGDCGGYNLQWCWSSAHAVVSHLAGGKKPSNGTVSSFSDRSEISAPSPEEGR